MDNVIFHGLNNYPDTIEGYRQMKLDVLSDFAIPITDTMKSEIEKRTTHRSLDNFCAYIIDRFLENPKMKNEHYFKLVLACKGAETIRADKAMTIVGYDGFYELVHKKLIKVFGISDGIAIYAL